MAKYRKASEKTISRGKGISTDKLSLSEAKDYFNERAKETGAKRFRHNGQVYDLAGNKVTESAPARSSGGGSSSSPAKPAAKPPARNVGGAKAEQRRAGVPPKAPAKAGAPVKRGEVSTAAVGAMGAVAVGAGVAAVRSGRNAGKPAAAATPRISASDRVRAAGAKVKSVAMGVPTKPVTKASTGGPARTPVAKPPVAKVPTPKTAKPKGTGGTRSGVRGGLGVDITTNPLEQIRDPLNLS